VFGLCSKLGFQLLLLRHCRFELILDGHGRRWLSGPHEGHHVRDLDFELTELSLQIRVPLGKLDLVLLQPFFNPSVKIRAKAAL
jgi:hypothetical protein